MIRSIARGHGKGIFDLRRPRLAWLSRPAARRTRCFLIALMLAQILPAYGGPLVPLASRPPAPDFVLSDITGADHRLSDLKGEVVLVNFWASWCAPCRAEMPSLERLRHRIGRDNFRILAVNIGEEKEEISRFYFSLDPPLGFTILMDRDMSVSQFWPMRGLPMSFLVDTAGRVTHVSSGARRWDTNDVAELIAELQAESGVREQTSISDDVSSLADGGS